MKAVEFACLAGNELTNGVRTLTYAHAFAPPLINIHMNGSVPSCYCAAIDDGPYVSPSADPAPWYVAAVPESAEFLGFFARTVDIIATLARDLQPKGCAGSDVGAPRLGPKLVVFDGTMYATSARGMEWGQRWLREILRGGYCQDGCSSDELIVLPACPADGDLDPDRAFRSLLGAATVDGPLFIGLTETFPECYAQRATFQIAAGEPWLFGPAEETIAEQTITSGHSVQALSTTEVWPGEATHVITVTGISMASLVIEGRVSLDGNCPPGNANNPCFRYEITGLNPEAELKIDGRRGRVTFVEHPGNAAISGYRFIDFEGPFVFPDLSPATQMCIKISVSLGSVKAKADKFVREF